MMAESNLRFNHKELHFIFYHDQLFMNPILVFQFESNLMMKTNCIIGHHPPTDCFVAWANNYMRIMERFQHIIVGTYLGHTHKDELIILYNKNVETNETYPVSLGYISPSITTFADVNPGYRIFTLDKNVRLATSSNFQSENNYHFLPKREFHWISPLITRMSC